MEKTIEHERLNVKCAVADPTQRQLEIYQEKLLEFTANAKSAAVYNSSIIRAAIEAGVLTGIEPTSVGEMKPAAVKFVSVQVAVWMKECQDIPSP